MRTYGAHGGENQLARYFAAEPRGDVEEHFAFIYPDADCAALFARTGARVIPHDLLATPLSPRAGPWTEVLALLPRLPCSGAIGSPRRAISASAAWRRRRSSPGRQRCACTDASLHLFPPHDQAYGAQCIRAALYELYAVLAGNPSAVAGSLTGRRKPRGWRRNLPTGRRSARAKPPAQTDGTVIAAGAAHSRQGLAQATCTAPPTHPDLAQGSSATATARWKLPRTPRAAERAFLGHCTTKPSLVAAATISLTPPRARGERGAGAMALGIPSVVCDALASPSATPGETGSWSARRDCRVIAGWCAT
jgi:hypothetical protein